MFCFTLQGCIVHHGGKVWQQGQEAAGHITPGQEAERGMVLLRALLCIQSETPDLDQTARFRVGSPSLGQPLREHLHRSLKVCLLGRSKSCKVDNQN